MKNTYFFSRTVTVTFVLLSISAVRCTHENSDSRDRSEYFRQLHNSGQDTCPVGEAAVQASALHAAAANANVDEVQAQLKNGAGIDAGLPASGWTALICAVGSGNLKTVRALLDRHADVNKKDRSGKTPLILAAQRGYTEIAQALIAANAEVNVVWEKRAALNIATALKDPATRTAVSEALLKVATIEIDQSAFPESSTALSNAVVAEDPNLVTKLLDRGAHPARIDPTHIRSHEIAALLKSKALPDSNFAHRDSLSTYPYSPEELEVLITEGSDDDFLRKNLWTVIVPESNLSRAWDEYYARQVRWSVGLETDAKAVADSCSDFVREVKLAQTGGAGAAEPLPFSVSLKLQGRCDVSVEQIGADGATEIERTLVDTLLAKNGPAFIDAFRVALEVKFREHQDQRELFVKRFSHWILDSSGSFSTAVPSPEVAQLSEPWSRAGIKLRAADTGLAIAGQYLEGSVRSRCASLGATECNDLQKQIDPLRSQIQDLQLARILASQADGRSRVSSALLAEYIFGKSEQTRMAIQESSAGMGELSEKLKQKLTDPDPNSPQDHTAIESLAALLVSRYYLWPALPADYEKLDLGTFVPSYAEQIEKIMQDKQSSPAAAGKFLEAAIRSALPQITEQQKADRPNPKEEKKIPKVKVK